jgi:hypothetical protein
MFNMKASSVMMAIRSKLMGMRISQPTTLNRFTFTGVS